MFNEFVDMINSFYKSSEDDQSTQAASDAADAKDTHNRQEIWDLIEKKSPEELREVTLESIEDRKKQDIKEVEDTAKHAAYEILINIYSTTFSIMNNNDLQTSIHIKKLPAYYNRDLFIQAINQYLAKAGLMIISNTSGPYLKGQATETFILRTTEPSSKSE